MTFRDSLGTVTDPTGIANALKCFKDSPGLNGAQRDWIRLAIEFIEKYAPEVDRLEEREGEELTVREMMRAAGYEDISTGGGCMAWAKKVGDKDESLLISNDNALYGDPNAKCWSVGRYGDGTHIDMVGEGGNGYTLPEAIDIAEKVPSSLLPGGLYIADSFETLEEVQGVVAAAVRALTGGAP